MGFLWFGRKKEEDLHDKVKKSFDAVKEDFKKTSDWIKHLHKNDGKHEENILSIDDRLSLLENHVEEIKQLLSFFGHRGFKQLSKQQQTAVHKQTAVQAVQTPVWTGVQTALKSYFLENLSMMERTIMWILLNSDMKLSYEDIAVLLGKNRSTVRGQINSIKQKSEGLIEESMEKSGKKRVFIPEEIRAELMRTIKNKSKGKKKGKRNR